MTSRNALRSVQMREQAEAVLRMFGGGAADAMALARNHLLAADEINRLRVEVVELNRLNGELADMLEPLEES